MLSLNKRDHLPRRPSAMRCLWRRSAQERRDGTVGANECIDPVEPNRSLLSAAPTFEEAHRG